MKNGKTNKEQRKNGRNDEYRLFGCLNIKKREKQLIDLRLHK